MGNTQDVFSLGALTATGAGSALSLEQRAVDGATVFIYGTFVGTVKIEVSPDGTNWVDAKDIQGTAISATTAGMHVLQGDAQSIRANCTAFTSGTINVKLLLRA